ncbi:3-dehydroquinate synthase [uncultured Imperialibacter sp.]|uniref:3-dehydroquinate synthase n=1 Tax=uncultured Imperialibacter sp. TaxID=1672639 RepID=UPI0030DBE400|tara:strand:- start:33328 stop:34497 length:1170 start_codon:yes stop_codon:yes gene_type:complete
MEFLQQSFSVKFDYKVYFTTNLFDRSNDTLSSFLKERMEEGTIQKVLFVLDQGVDEAHPGLKQGIQDYFETVDNIHLILETLVVPGGEEAKNDESLLYQVIDAVNAHGIDRHSYLVAIGGGAVLDMVGYAAAISHRGVRHIRIPTTVLSQNDSGVGVKNGVNFYRKKNFLGTFAPPVAVFNDYHFLTTLSDLDWRSGMSEAVKVALIKDASFFDWIEHNATMLAARDMGAMKYLVKRCAALHLDHIAGKDPFETGSSRPLDFGHWSAHKLEALADFSIRHGEAVAIGIALDTVYSMLTKRLSEDDARRILVVLQNLGFPLQHPLLKFEEGNSPLLDGLSEFREHLGGKLTIMLLIAIGTGEEVHEMNEKLIRESSEWLERYAHEQTIRL